MSKKTGTIGDALAKSFERKIKHESINHPEASKYTVAISPK
jgi:hypothetical protein